MDNAPEVTKEDLQHVHSRIDDLEGWVKKLLHKVEEGLERVAKPVVSAVAKAADVVAPAPVAAALEVLADAIPCPDHPDAPQTANGCTAKGCTFSPPPATD